MATFSNRVSLGEESARIQRSLEQHKATHAKVDHMAEAQRILGLRLAAEARLKETQEQQLRVAQIIIAAHAK